MNYTIDKSLLYLCLTSVLLSCGSEVGPQGTNSLTNVTNEPSGVNCENGGIKVEVGLDNNENGILEADEIQSTSYVCNGVNGSASLTKVTTEAAGTNCSSGGLKIDTGLDTNGDGTLDDSEISATAYVCNGIDGNNSLTKITNEAAGTNCENGGLKIDTGVDANGDGTLDDSEISTTAYVCNGIEGNNSLTKITNEAAGTNCTNGGLKIDTGLDTNADGTLDDSEIFATAYVCNGIVGNNSLTKITNEAAGTNCANGGLKIDTGVDANGDGTLDDSEISATAYVCNGIDGNNSLTKITNEAAGTNCANGGLKIDTGLDANGNGTLDDSEVSATAYVCNGIEGNNSLTKITNAAAGTNCTNGGLKIDTGVDANTNGTLDDSEISATAYVCNGIDGNNSLTKITTESAGNNCENGGLKIESGVDTNGSGTLDNGEITSNYYLCKDGFVGEVRISFNFFGQFVDTFGILIIDGDESIKNFNINNFIGADSVALSAEVRTSDSNSKCILELYDITNGQIVANSQIQTSNTTLTTVTSSLNFIKNIADGPLNLGLRLTSENGSPVQAAVKYPELIIIGK